MLTNSNKDNEDLRRRLGEMQQEIEKLVRKLN